MTGNEHFPEPEVPMPDFNKASQRLQAAINNRDNGKLAQIEVKNASSSMDIMLRMQAISITEISKGNLALLETTGYKISKHGSTKSVIPSMPVFVKLESKNNNVTLITKKTKSASTICWVVYVGDVTGGVTVENNQVIVPAGVSAIILSSAKAREVLKGIATGTKVTAQALAQNSAGKSSLSEPVSIYVNK